MNPLTLIGQLYVETLLLKAKLDTALAELKQARESLQQALRESTQGDPS
jgi:hypothetical protein